ncbi:MAG TPA: hypothetical protein VK324_17505, partial [Tepidisphaeraceae bacterium]|nr:hypothetical protein [Tepidisphaeraceae bacterium]
MSRLVAVIFIMTFTSATARAAPPTTQPGSALRQFDEESRALYASVHGAVLRAEVPVLRDPPGPDELLRKWKHKLDPAFRAKLEQELRDRAAPGRQQAPVPGSATRPVAEWILVGSCLVVGDDGRVLVPAYVDGPTLGGRKVRVFAADGAVRTAALVGVDRPTNLSVLKLDQPPARSVRFSAQRPVPGQLLMVISG